MISMHLLGYCLALGMGMTLGLIGAGGSILTVPILVYLFGLKPVVAMGYSLLIVASAAFVGALRYFRAGLVCVKTALLFALPAMVAVLLTRRYLVPNLPDTAFFMPRDDYLMVFFALLMIVAAFLMLHPLRVTPLDPPHQDHGLHGKTSQAPCGFPLEMTRLPLLILGSASIGVLTGLVGAGGGFLIIPTLIALFGLPMKQAIGTSLTIITLNAFVGFKGDLLSGNTLDWLLLLKFVGITLLGMWLGSAIGHKIHSQKLKTFFGVFTLLLGIIVMGMEGSALFSLTS